MQYLLNLILSRRNPARHAPSHSLFHYSGFKRFTGDETLAAQKKAMVEKHIELIRQGGQGRRADRVSAGDLQRAILLR